MAPNKTAFLNEVQGFATAKFAEKRALEVSTAIGDKLSYFIFPNAAGRFVPVFINNERASVNVWAIANKGCAIMN